MNGETLLNGVHSKSRMRSLAILFTEKYLINTSSSVLCLFIILFLTSPTVFAIECFTIGSDSSEVRQLQGTPNKINRHEYLGYELWWYGSSNVKISLNTGKVIEWSSSRSKLQVKLEPGSNTTNLPYFTRGSHKDDVLRLQGTPTSVDRRDYLGYEMWWYGSSNVKISLNTDRVIEWSSSNTKLHVKLEPGSNTSQLPYYTRGSHKDDVLRLQGTPTSVDRRDYLGYEMWWYGSSNLKISIKSKCVLAFINSGNLKTQDNDSEKHLTTVSQHYNYGDVTLYYDENSAYTGIFSIDVHDDIYYGISNDGVALFFDNEFQPLHVTAYWNDDEYIIQPTSKTIDMTWYNDFKSGISLIDISGDLSGSGSAMQFGNMTFYDLVFDDGLSVSGTSMEFDPITFDDFYTSYGVSITGSRMTIGDFTFGDWSTSTGMDISGTSTDMGNIIFHDYTTSDGKTITGSTIEIGDWQFIELEEW